MGLVVVVAAITTLQIAPGLSKPTWRAIERKFVNRFEQNLADCGHKIYHIVINCCQTMLLWLIHFQEFKLAPRPIYALLTQMILMMLMSAAPKIITVLIMMTVTMITAQQ